MILFFIGCFSEVNTGAGGHYYSLLQMKNALTEESQIVVFGDFIPQTYETETVIFIKTSMRNVLNADVSVLTRIAGVKCIHAYDIAVSLIGSKVAARLKVPFINTKPGGPPIKRWSLSFQNQIVFHPFDLNYFQSRGLLAPKHVCMIPNRVARPSVADNNRPNPFVDSPKDAIKLLRIARIGHTYKQSILQSILLAERINQEHGRCDLAIVGKIEDQDAFDDIQKRVADKPFVRLFTDKTYTLNAAELVPYADVVVGTGRGLIEALSYGKMIFFPVNQGDLPCFLTEKTYQEAFYHNFSQRVPLSEEVAPEARLLEFYQVLQSDQQQRVQTLAETLFNQDHLIDQGAKRLIHFYNQIENYETPKDYYLKFVHSKVLNTMKTLKKQLIK